ncbi:MAG TPA: 5-(carboxyamino)imidazole ribonucleotide mutase [Sumerlaeia bacterium]|nr:5-(carboxyamino)imidazole ribonucleotide mutase [Sumerlaeia bacterium]
MSRQIGIVLGSYNDVKRMKPGLDRLEALGVPFEMCIASAHRTPGRLVEWLGGAESRGVRVIIAGAGAAAHLPGVVASKTLLPVIGVPFDASALKGVDALHSIVQMPPGIPVATVGIDGAENAVILALQILALHDETIREKLGDYRGAWRDKIADQNVRLYAEYPDARPADEGWGVPQGPPQPAPCAPADSTAPHAPHGPRPPAPPDTAKPARSSAGLDGAEPGLRARGAIRRVNPEAPEVSIIEEAVDVLLDGGVVAAPTDTVYGLVADATNPEAVERLYRIKQRDRTKAIAVLIDTMKMFRRLTETVGPAVEDLLERRWPGPLTLVARKRRAVIRAVTSTQTLGLRMPDNLVALGLISMMARPLAATSANLSGDPPANTAEAVAARFGGSVDLILDAGPAGSGQASTVLNVVDTPYRIQREGAVVLAELKEALGDLLAE